MLSTVFVLSALGLRVFAQSSAWGQCGGTGWAGDTTCVAGYACIYSNPYYSQCIPGSASTTTASTTATATTTTSTTATSPTSTTKSSTTTSTTTSSAPSSTSTFPSKVVGKLPALGWNSWNAYGCSIDESKLVAAANQMVSLGLKAAGYQYVNIDDCWSNHTRDTQDRLVPDSTKFPNGLTSVTSKIHALGLKVGIYSDAGTMTCSGYPGSIGREALDAATWSSWGIDYLKYDNCNVPGNWSDSSSPPGGDWYNSNSALRYRQMSAALVAQSNPIQLSICIWGAANVAQWGARVGHSWRVSGDITPDWNSITSIINTGAQSVSSEGFYGHGDLDMMEIGNGALTIQEQRSHFAIWAFLKSPIILGTDLSKLNSTQLSIITNTELLAFSQDNTVSAPAKPFTPSGATATSPPSYYAGASSKGFHVALLNTGSSISTMSFDFASVPGLSGSSFKVHDMWTGKDVGTFSGKYSVSVASHDTAAYLITPA